MSRANSCSSFYGTTKEAIPDSEYFEINKKCLNKSVKLPSFTKGQTSTKEVNFLQWLQSLQNDFQMISIHDIDFSKIVPQFSGLFAAEYHPEGKRNCFIMDYKRVFEDFLQSFPNPHLYEVIPAGHPCHLYFDVEFQFSEHPEYDGPSIMQDLLQIIDDKLYDYFGIDDYSVIHLDATSETKFSRHLIVKCPGFAFKTNKQVGFFVHNYILPMASKPVQVSVDPGVYSNNRTFRCVWCTKMKTGKNPLLPLDGQNQSPKISTLSFFTSTLISNVDPKSFQFAFSNFDENSSTNTTFVQISPQNGFPNNFNTQKIDAQNLNQTMISFVLDQLAPGGTADSVRYCPQYDIVTIRVKGTRFCRRIGREHKSNQIYLVCRLGSGVAVQKCFDPDCKGFESIPVVIPDNILTAAREQFRSVSQKLEANKCSTVPAEAS